MEYEIKKKIHITCPHCEKAIETEIEIELEIEEKKKKDKHKLRGRKSKSKQNPKRNLRSPVVLTMEILMIFSMMISKRCREQVKYLQEEKAPNKTLMMTMVMISNPLKSKKNP